jgi:sugar phosphate permease
MVNIAGPSLMLITAQWYTKSEQAPRFAFWHSAPGVGQLIGALLSFGFQAVPKSFHVQSWRLLFITLGIVTLVVGVCCWFYLPDSPMHAKFLNDKEKVALLNHVSVNMTGVENRKIRPKELLEAATDVQVWMLTLGLFMVRSPPRIDLINS